MNHRIRTAILPLFSLLLLTAGSEVRSVAAEATNASAAFSIYEEPRLLTGTIYTAESAGKKLLYKFTRVSTRAGGALKVQRDYTYPDGRLAARELITYLGDALVSFELEESQIGASGIAKVLREGAGSTKPAIDFSYTKEPGAKSKLRTEELAQNTLNSDMIATFLAANWDKLARGEKVKSRYLVVPRAETVGFTFGREPESQGQDRNVVIVKMEATSVILAALVDPLFFTLEKALPHRVLQYTGRTTPKIQVDGKWKDLDAVTVFDWGSTR